jgi:hypothetical protein
VGFFTDYGPRMTRRAIVISGACLVVTLLFVLASFTAAGPGLDGAQIPFFVGAIAINFRTVFVLRRRGIRNQKDVYKLAPFPLIALFGVVFAAGWLNGFASIHALRGQPIKVDGRYVLNDHGSYIPVSKTEWDHAHALQLRLFSGGGAVFYCLALVANVAVLNYRDPTVSPGT